MHVTVPTNALADGLKAVGGAVSKRASLPSLGGVRIKAARHQLSLEATDLEIGITHTIGDIVCLNPASVVVPHAVLKQAVGTFSGDKVSIMLQPDGTVELRSAKRCVRLRSLPAEDFPALVDCDQAWMHADAAAMVGALARVATCASSDEARPVLTAIQLEAGEEALEVVATDSYRLGYQRVPVRMHETTDPVLMPARLAQIIGRQERKTSGEMSVHTGEAIISLRFGATRYSARCIQGDYPNWRQLVPQRDGGALTTFDAAELAGEVRGVAVFARAGAPIRIACSSTNVKLAAGTHDLGEATSSLAAARFDPSDGEALTIAFNPAYVLDGLKFLDAGEVRMWSRDGLKPSIFANGAPEECFYLLMPVRV